MRILVISLLLLGCNNNSIPRVKEKVNMDRCVLECVHNYTYSFNKIEGSVIQDVTKLCADALKGRECCRNQAIYSYVTPCDEQ